MHSAVYTQLLQLVKPYNLHILQTHAEGSCKAGCSVCAPMHARNKNLFPGAIQLLGMPKKSVLPQAFEKEKKRENSGPRRDSRKAHD